MNETRSTVPVAMLIFNRPEVTAQVFERIRQARPPMLLVVADGPRASKPGEDQRCAAARAVTEQVDWECQVLRNYSAENLGCRLRVSSGLDWVFSNVERAIILEDDCLPDLSFFPYCSQLLERYANDSRVMAISGDNFQFGRKRGPFSYYFSRYPHIWGWASWQRAWKHYDVDLQLWPQVRDSDLLEQIFVDRPTAKYFRSLFEQAHRRQIDTWDYQWLFACLMQSGLCALPNVNLISNIGFTGDATHTQKRSSVADLPAQPISFPLSHPTYIVRHAEADRYTDRTLFVPSLFTRIVRRGQQVRGLIGGDKRSRPA